MAEHREPEVREPEHPEPEHPESVHSESEHPESEQRRSGVRELDARSLRGLAHPLRMQLLDALRLNGPATASQLAERLGESSGSTSYHLRQLAAHGFVEDAPEHGKGRERWWRAAIEGLRFDDDLLESANPAVRGAADLYLHEIATTHAREVSTWLGTRDDRRADWVGSTDLSSMTLRLTPERTRDLIEKMHDLVESYREAPGAEAPPGAETVRIHTHAFPLPKD
ncbi:helix-turn-helix domain-containing protein [Streptomyces sp. NPDC047017]|uniref:helix-turn-helix domain-containing protein n=1 Tax=Streptomyces sp. NPDC047017 TaxID=3155024 RepID=UPI0033F17A2C